MSSGVVVVTDFLSQLIKDKHESHPFAETKAIEEIQTSFVEFMDSNSFKICPIVTEEYSQILKLFIKHGYTERLIVSNSMTYLTQLSSFAG